jgi:PAT family acetyl-CoA transporter-like MFS transporter 1
LAEQGTELKEISPENSKKDIEEKTSEESTESGDDSDSILLDEKPEEEPLVAASASSPRQMKRNARKNKDKNSPSPLNLKIETGQNGHINGNGHANGHANGSMNSHTEMRRKHVSEDVDSPTARAQLMGRSDFSLDNEVPEPPTPRTPGMVNTNFSNLPATDKRNFLLLCLLYFLQGIPMGLASGSVPFLLKQYLSYGQIGIFSLAMYPYSLKLLWSPIVDAVWSRKFGRRKSWIVPIQAVSGLSMIYLGWKIDEMMVVAGADGGAGAWTFTGWWFLLVFLCATQDIAVDGWAISLLSIQNISYASTAQTVGLTAGSFLSYTVFLAFNSPDFANRWFRTKPQDYGLMTLGGYMEFAGWLYLIVTIGLAALKREERNRDKDGIMEVYRSMWGILKLKNIMTIMIIHLIAKVGFITNDAVTNLKLLDKGFGQANMALVVLIDFPFEISLGYYAGKWSTEYTPLRLWCWAFMARLAAAVFAQITIMIYPSNPVPAWYMLVVIAEHIYSTFMSTVMFVALSAFHARIADPAIGGTYMTLLAT